MTGAAYRRLWLTAGGLLIGYIALTFAGVALQQSPMLGDDVGSLSAAFIESSMPKTFTGGYVEFLGTLVYLVAALLVARLLRGDDAIGDWLSSCIASSAVAMTAVNVAVGFPAGAAAIYDGHQGVPLATVTAINDIRNFAFFLSGGLAALFAVGVAAAVLRTRRLPRWVAFGGLAVGVLHLVTIPAAGSGLLNIATLLGFIWLAALAVASLRRARRRVIQPVAPEVVESI